MLAITVTCFIVFMFVFHFALFLSGGHDHVRYAFEVSKHEGWYKFPLIFYQSHMFTKYERMFMNSCDKDSKYSPIFLSNVESALNANLSGIKARNGTNFIEFPEKNGKIVFNTSPLFSGFEVTPSLITMRVSNKLYIFPPRIIFKLRKVRAMNGYTERKKNAFDKRK